jgi:opacity protein-like surface antigen
MVKKKVQGVMALAVLWLSTGAVQAADLLKNAQADVSLLGGGSTLVDVQNWTTAGYQFHSRMDWGTKFSAGVAVPYGKILSIETAFSFGPNNLIVSNLNLFPHVGVQYPVNVYMGSLAGVLHGPFSLFHFRPYAEAGVEYDHFSPTQAAINTAKNQGFATVSTAIITHNDKIGVNVGVGVDRKLTKRLSFRIDLRDHVTGSPAFGLPVRPTADSLGAFYPVRGRGNNIMYTAGIVFHLGKL